MKLGTLLKWLLGIAVLAALTGLGLAFSSDRYPGIPIDDAPLALVGGRVYDPVGDSVIPNATVIVRGRTISALGARLPVPDGARVRNVSGLTLLPGYIDSHVHLSGLRPAADGSRSVGWLRYVWLFTRSFPERRRELIEAGVTSVKSLGDPYPWIDGFGAAIGRHELGGPRVFAGGPMFTAPGGHPVAALRRGGQGDTSFIVQVARQLAGPAQASESVREVAGAIDFVSVVLERLGDPDLPSISLSTLRELTGAAHAEGLDVLVHVGSVDDVTLALSVGVDGIEHVPTDALLDSMTLEALRGAGIMVDPTLVATGARALTRGDTSGAEHARDNARRVRQAGVPIVVGSDSPNPVAPFGLAFQEELRNLVSVGYTPREVIAAATWHAAEHLGMSDRLGTIEVGKLADIIGVAGDPLVDIIAAGDLYVVVADGQLLLDRLDRLQRPGAVIASAPPARNRP